MRRDIDELIAVDGPPDVSPAALRVQAVLGEDQTSRDIAILLTQLTEEGYLAAVVERLAGIDEGLREIEREFIGLAPTACDTEIADLSQRAAYRARAFLVATERLAAPPGGAADSHPVDLLTDALLGPMNRAQRRVVGAVLDALADLA
ncbi:MerR family transcriptional regulator [Leucobacter sp. BZR 635]